LLRFYTTGAACQRLARGPLSDYTAERAPLEFLKRMQQELCTRRILREERALVAPASRRRF